MRPTWLWLALLAACSQKHVTVHAEFDHWIEPDGTTHWLLTLPPEAWKQLGHGERLDATHQNISERTVKTVSELIDANLDHMHLCPGEWTMGDIRRFDNGYLTFAGSCDMPAGART
jgi:hypothetical protein